MVLGTLFALLQEVFFFAAYVNGGNSFPEPLSPEEEARCIALAAEGDEEARRMLIEHNLRLVAHIAKKYAGNRREQDDVISIGAIGLIKAVSTFRPNRGTALATYAARCIENEILMSIRAEKKQAGEVSLSESIGTDRDGNDVSLAEVLGSEPTLVSDEVELRIAAEQLRALLRRCLSERERVVIELRYGLTGGHCMPQREIAALMGISRSYVSRIEKKALVKLNAAFQERNTPIT